MIWGDYMNEVTYGIENGKQYAEYNGIKYWLRESQGYYYSGARAIGIKKVMMLHRMVFINHYGEIKKGYHIHHIDGNKDNNEIENLICLSASDHEKLHTKNWSTERLLLARKHMEENMRPKANKWHGSKEGLEWHKQHYEKMKDKLYEEVECVCTVCGKTFIAHKKGGSKCCSKACRAKERRDSGLDNEIRKCEVCGAEFTVSRFEGKRTCSKKCKSVICSNNNMGEKSPKSKAVNQYDMDMNFIKRWDCMADVTRELGISSSNISACCRGAGYKSAGGFKWLYADK